LGGTYTFDSGLSVDADFLYSIAKDAAYYVDVSQEQIGVTTTGQPIFDYATGRDNFMLTNSDRDAKSTSFSLVARHDYDFGLDWMVGYAFTDAEDISPMTSSTAGSNFDNLALTLLLILRQESLTTTRHTASQRVCRTVKSSSRVTSHASLRCSTASKAKVRAM